MSARPLWLSLVIVVMTVVWTMLSTQRVVNLVDDEQEIGDSRRSWVGRADRSMMESLTQASAGLRSSLSVDNGAPPPSEDQQAEVQTLEMSKSAGADAAIAAAASYDTTVEQATFEADSASEGIPVVSQEQGRAPQDGASSLGPVVSAVVESEVAPSTTFLQPQNEELAAETSSVIKALGQCTMQRHTDAWGEILQWGPDFKVDTAEACCQACFDYQPRPEMDMMECNVWVYCEDAALCGEQHRECWLKHKAQPRGANVAPRGPEVGWTTGIMAQQEEPQPPSDPKEDRRFHVVITAHGTPGMHWAARVGYYWYKKVKAQCEVQGSCQMGGFTRLLHDGQPDELMAEIPTWVAQPLPPEHPDHGYVVLNRPYGFLQWVIQVEIPEKYVLMSEPDHIWLKPMPNLMRGQRPASFPFFYIEPWKKEFINITSKFLGPLTRAAAEKIAPVGNAPTLMSVADMKRVVPVWFNLSIEVHQDEDANREWGWVQEMYAFALACYRLHIDVDLHPWMMAQPPYDSELKKFYILHYTYSDEYNAQGEMTWGKGDPVWKFNKRDYYTLPLPRGLPEPPPNVKNQMVHHLIRAINEATDKIPGWEQYAQSGRAEQLWDGTL